MKLKLLNSFINCHDSEHFRRVPKIRNMHHIELDDPNMSTLYSIIERVHVFDESAYTFFLKHHSELEQKWVTKETCN